MIIKAKFLLLIFFTSVFSLVLLSVFITLGSIQTFTFFRQSFPVPLRTDSLTIEAPANFSEEIIVESSPSVFENIHTDNNPNHVLRFINIGDWGNFDYVDTKVFRLIEKIYKEKGFTDLFTNGDNNYGDVKSFDEFMDKELGFLLSSGVDMHMSLGNHDVETKEKILNQTTNTLWGEWNCTECLTQRSASAENRYYSVWRDPVRFIILDTNLLLKNNTDHEVWMKKEIAASVRGNEPWQIVIAHHPLFSSGIHGDSKLLQEKFKNYFTTSGIDLVLNGHDHFYERIKTSRMCGDGVLYVVNGGIKLRQGGASVNDCTQAYWDQTPSFMYIEASVEYLEGTAISDDGQIIDTWKILRKKP